MDIIQEYLTILPDVLVKTFEDLPLSHIEKRPEHKKAQNPAPIVLGFRRGRQVFRGFQDLTFQQSGIFGMVSNTLKIETYICIFAVADF